MIIVHVLEPFASGITTALISITTELSEYRHVVIHGSRAWVDSVEKVKARFPGGVEFIEWKSAVREISLRKDCAALAELVSILKTLLPGKKGPGIPVDKEGDPAVLHLHSSKAGFLGRVAARLLGIRTVIYTPHCGAFLRTDVSPLKQGLYRLFERLGGLFGGRLVGCGPSEGEIYRRLGFMYKDAEYVSNGVVPRNTPAAGRRNLVSFSGIVSAQKDPALFNTIALYFQPVLSGGAGTKDGTLFYWIGEGPEGAKLDRNRIHLTGWKEPEAVRALLEKTAVYLSCSAWEGLPYGVLEAMNASCALLLRDVPGNRDLVVPGENGRLFTGPEEACRLLQDMLAEPEKTADMGKRSRAILEERFSQKAMGAGYRRVYAKTLGTPNSFAEDREAHSRGEALP